MEYADRQMANISNSFCEGLDTFKRLTELFTHLFSGVSHKMYEWEKKNKDHKLNIQDGSNMLKMMLRLHEAHDNVRRIRWRMTALYNSFMRIYGQPGAKHDMQCGEQPIDEMKEYHIFDSQKKEDLVTGMVYAAGIQESSLMSESQFFNGVKKLQGETIVSVYCKFMEEITDKNPDEGIVIEEFDVGEMKPTDVLVLLLKELITKRKPVNQNALVEVVARICDDFWSLIHDVELNQFESITNVFLKSKSISSAQLLATWYVIRSITSNRNIDPTGCEGEHAAFWTLFKQVLPEVKARVNDEKPKSARAPEILSQFLAENPINYGIIYEVDAPEIKKTPSCQSGDGSELRYAGRIVVQKVKPVQEVEPTTEKSDMQEEEDKQQPREGDNSAKVEAESPCQQQEANMEIKEEPDTENKEGDVVRINEEPNTENKEGDGVGIKEESHTLTKEGEDGASVPNQKDLLL